jgi:pimeloyl-ACP methyl ester carboxylesterase
MWYVQSFKVAGAALAILMAVASVGWSQDAPTKLATAEFMIDAAESGTKLYVRNKHPENMQRFAPERTLLFVHGARQPAEVTFDLPLDGLSWMDYVARHGWDVYLVDVRGYGRSTRPPQMDQPAEKNPPVVKTDVAIKDVSAAVEFILRRRNIPRLSLIGWSWGCTIMAAYTADHNDRVERLVLYGPDWVTTPPASQAVSRPLGAYVTATMKTAREGVQSGVPEDKKDELMPPAWFEAWSAAALASDPVGSRQDPPVLRSPSGVFQDDRDYWQAGKPYYDAARITVPTLIIVAEWDQVAPDEGAQRLFHKLPSRSEKRLVEIGEGTHVVMLEKNRTELFREVQHFLDKPRGLTGDRPASR